VKFRKKPIQSVSELEMVVESLKRVVEKLKVENEHLKKENAKYSGVGEKVNLEKSLRTKISNLETIIQSHEMKDVNLDEQKQTIKKLIDANKQLRFDLEKEVDRYTLLENKYRDVLSRFNLLDKEN
jgi:cell fate regulator YaaT (PSP1 superfamily)